MTKEEIQYHDIAASIDKTEKGQMFGKPCYKIYKKAFCCFFQNEMVFKLKGEMHQEALSLGGSKLFDPSGKGRAMKEWVQVSFDYSSRWREFAIESLVYVKG